MFFRTDPRVKEKHQGEKFDIIDRAQVQKMHYTYSDTVLGLAAADCDYEP